MPLPDTFGPIRSHPRWAELSLPEQNQIREAWAQSRLLASDDPRNPKLYKSFLDEAYLDAPEWAKPMQSLTPGKIRWSALKGTAGEFGKEFIGAGGRVLGVPQQFVANLIEQGVGGFSGYEAPEKSLKGAVETVTRPFKRTYETAMRLRPPTELSETPGLEILGETVTDPLMYVGVGLLPRIRDARKFALLRKAGVTKAIPSLYGKESREALRTATHLPPSVFSEIGELPRSWATFSPQQQSLYKQVISLGKANIPRDQLKRVAETVANNPDEGEKVLGLLKAGKDKGIESIISWAESASWKRPTIRGRIKPPTSGIKAPLPAGDINEPGYLADSIEAIVRESGAM